jgi:iron complex outermembrane receptor protein
MKYFYAIALLFVAIITFGQTNDSVALDEVVILQERMPLKISDAGRQIVVVTAEEIKKINAVSINEVLSFVNGVDLRQRGPMGVQADVGIRGGSFDQTLILINGMKVSDPQTGHHAMNVPIPVENIERIEVIKGPAARLYGPNAYSGAINIITKPGVERDVVIHAMYGQNNLHGANVTINLPGEKVKQSLSLAASGSDSFVYNTDFKIRNALYQLQADVLGWEVDVMAAANAKKFGANNFYTSAYPDQYEETETYFTGVTASKNLGENFKLVGRLYARQHNDRFLLKREEPSFYENLHTTNTWAAEIAGQTNWGKAAINFGLDARKEIIESNNLGNHQRDITGVYIDVKYPLGKLLLNPGVNVSTITGFDPQTFPGLDLSYNLGKGYNLFASWGTAFRVPTYTDLYYVGFENIGNDALAPETATSIEFGSKYTSKNVTSSISVFNRNAQNAIEWVRPNDTTKWQPQNFTQVRTTGVEANFSVNVNKRFLNTVSLNATFLNVDFGVVETGFESRYQIESIRAQIIGRVNHNIYKELQHSFSVRYIDRFSFTNDYFVIDSRIIWQKKYYGFFAEATNLLNAQYNETSLVQMPGRWIRFGANVKIGY